jgi:hypothetical protein
MTYTIQLGRKYFNFNSLRECQTALIHYRDGDSGNIMMARRSSEFLVGDGNVFRNDTAVGHFSYNGRFWRGRS